MREWGQLSSICETEPTPCAPGPERPVHHRRRRDCAVFGDAALCFALQIAVGSHPPDPHWYHHITRCVDDPAGGGWVHKWEYPRGTGFSNRYKENYPEKYELTFL
jgi:hypothetical protein